MALKIWLAYRFTGADREKLRMGLQVLRASFAQQGLRMYTLLEDIQNWDPDCMSKAEAVRLMLGLMQECDGLIALYDSRDGSDGRGWEAGYFAGLGKPTTMALRNGVSLKYHEAMYAANPANSLLHWPSVIRFDRIDEIAAAFVEQRRVLCSGK